MTVTASEGRRGRAKSSSQGRAPFLPQTAVWFLHRRLSELAGLGLVVLAVALAVALLSYSPSDPSWNTATADSGTSNWLGSPGAYAADALLQPLGVAAVLLVVIFAAWGWRLIGYRGISPVWVRLTMLPICVIAAAMALAGLAPGEAWSLRAGLGGTLGTVLLRDVTVGVQSLAPSVGPGMVAWAAGALALITFVPAVALGRGDWRALGRGIWWAVRGVGALAGAGRARLRRPARGAAPQSAAEETVAPLVRVEPHLQDTPAEAPATPGPRVEPAAVSEDLVETPAAPRPARGTRNAAQKSLALDETFAFDIPDVNLLDEVQVNTGRKIDEAGLKNNAHLLESVLKDFGVNGEIVKVRPGPVVTLYELEPAPGTKTSRVIGLADDLARSMSAVSVRVAVVPGQSTIGIELPNREREMVLLRDLLASRAYEKAATKLPLVLGKDIGGSAVIADLAKMPHLLVAGTTGSGKSVAINAMILSLLYRLTPRDVRFIMIDPKMLELSVYDGIPHLLSPVVTDPRKAVVALKWVVREMEDRYRAMSKLGVRNIGSYNAQLAEARSKGKPLMRTVQTGFDDDTGAPVFEEQELDLAPLPFIVVVADEIADLMLVAGKDIEAAIQRLAQMARAAGIHLILATQRPSVDVITGTIKANLPTRISFQVTSKIDSRTILGEQGAEQLLGQGDMLYMAAGGRVTRVHGPFVSDDEVERVCAFLKAQGDPLYERSVTEDEDVAAGIPGFGAATDGGDGDDGDDLYRQAVELIQAERKASTSFVQRHLQIGYNRAARIIERMEREGLVSAANHVGKREILLPE